MCDTLKDDLNRGGSQHKISILMKLFWDFFESQNKKKRCKKFWESNTSPIECDDQDNDTPVMSPSINRIKSSYWVSQ